MSERTDALRSQAAREVRTLLEHGVEALGKRPRGHRGWMAMVKAALVGHYSGLKSGTGVVDVAERWLGELEALQAPSGLFTSGDNLASPPDSAFTINDAALTVAYLRRHAAEDALAPRLEGIMARALPALISGGVHTPNHRWEIASALVAAGDLLGGDLATAATHRAADWLGEGVDVDADGLYSERSPNYAAYVSNPALLTLAQSLGRPELTGIVHENLHAQLDLTAPDGGIETIHSRRQDQFDGPFPLGPFASHFAVFAAECGRCRRGARRALDAPDLEAVDVLVRTELDERVAAGLGAAGRSAAVPDPEPPVDRWFTGPRLWRRSDGRHWSSVYGGSDVPAAGRIGSGLATNPTFLRAGWGAVEFSSVRLSRDFFAMGPFRAEQAVRDADRMVLREELKTAYYQPLPERSRNAAGEYRLEHEGRFAAAMAFSERDADPVRLSTTVTYEPGTEGSVMSVQTEGAASGHALEIALPADTSIEGAQDLGEGRYLLTGATTLRRGADTVVIEPDTASSADVEPTYDPGEAYTFLAGTDAMAGLRLYLTWRSPATVRLHIRGGTPSTTETR